MTLLQHLWVAPLCLAPVSGNEALQHAKKNFYSGSHRDIFAQGLPKNEFSWVPTRRVEYPHVISITPMGSHPCALTHSLATLGSYPCTTIVRMTPSKDSCTHSLSENEFSNDTHIPCMAHLQHPQGRTTGLCPGLWQQSTARCQKKLILSPPVHFRPRYPLKRVLHGYPPGGLSTHMGPL